ncbi:MAG: hypothetical protein NTX82_07565, partial [Candidatus Parcubacteria bacterium]|nr:hypothetical protein [Candidatus Parcubacteria bacterium]
KGEFGRIFFEWQVPEYTMHERSNAWYIVMAIIGIALVIYSIFTANFLFALIIILATFIVYLRVYYTPKDLICQITEDGIIIGNQFFGYEMLQNFYIIYYPPAIKKLFFRRKGLNLTDISVPLDKMNPVIIRKQLLDYLNEDLEKEHQSMADLIEMLFKL